jgi:hypothetical protein
MAYDRALDIVRHSEGSDSPQLITPSISLGKIYEDEYFSACASSTSEYEVSTSLSRNVHGPRFENGFAVDAPGQIASLRFPVIRSAPTADR